MVAATDETRGTPGLLAAMALVYDEATFRTAAASESFTRRASNVARCLKPPLSREIPTQYAKTDNYLSY